MKKLFSILLALAMTVSLTVPAFADEPDYTTGTPWPCIDLDGVVTEETTAELKDNFALAVSGGGGSEEYVPRRCAGGTRRAPGL